MSIHKIIAIADQLTAISKQPLNSLTEALSQRGYKKKSEKDGRVTFVKRFTFTFEMFSPPSAVEYDVKSRMVHYQEHPLGDRDCVVPCLSMAVPIEIFLQDKIDSVCGGIIPARDAALNQKPFKLFGSGLHL